MRRRRAEFGAEQDDSELVNIGNTDGMHSTDSGEQVKNLLIFSFLRRTIKQAEAHTKAIASMVTDMPTKADIEVMRVGIETLRDTVKDYKDSTGRHLSLITTLIVLILASILGYAFGLLPADRQNTPAPAVQYVPVPVPAPAPAADPPAPLPLDAE